MSVSTERTVWCDNCVEWVTICIRTKVGARQEAFRLFGYRYVDGKDLCPKCATQEVKP